MKCPKCNKVYDEKFKFCSKCGCLLVAEKPAVKKDQQIAHSISQNTIQKTSSVPDKKTERESLGNIVQTTCCFIVALVIFFSLMQAVLNRDSHNGIFADRIMAKSETDSDYTIQDEAEIIVLEPEPELESESTITEVTTEPTTASEYVIPDSDKRYLTRSDLDALSTNQLRIARNEIYARHNRRFNDAELQKYFDGCSWYNGSIAPESFDAGVFNAYENANKDFILKVEKERG